MFKYKILMILIIFWISSASYAGITGKIIGKITDAETGEPLPGANVMLENTTLGAATNSAGEFLILNISPGSYTLLVKMMGYVPQRIQNIRVNIDQTTSVLATLNSEVIAGEEVVIVASRPIIEKDVSNSQKNLSSQEIQIMPIEKIQSALSLQAGIEMGSEGIMVRGGSANQTVFMVDGLSLNDERSNIPYAAVSQSAAQEIQIQTGGFNAEYGNIRSGLVNVVTREGSDKYSGLFSIHYRPAAPKHFGSSLYAPDSYFNKSFLDPDVCWTGTRNGAWDLFTQKQYPTFEGWNAISLKTLQDNNPENDITPEGAKRLYEWEHRRQGDIAKPDYVIDAGVGGPVPFVGKYLGQLKFYFTHYNERDMFIFPLSRESYDENHTMLKLTSKLNQAITLNITGLYGEIYSVSPYDWTTTPTGRLLRNQSEIADLLNASSGASMLYMPGYYSPGDIYRNMFGIKFTHILTQLTYYEVNFQHKINRYNTYKMTNRDTTRQFEVIPGYYVDEAPNGYWGYSVSGVEGMSMGGWMNLGRDYSVNSTTSLNFDLTSQINDQNQVKTGFQIIYNDFDINSRTESPSMGTWTRSMLYRVFPYRIGAYFQDKLEFSGFIANVGLRLDYSNPNSGIYLTAVYDKNLSAGYGNSIEENVSTKKAKASWAFCPRLGISHPITVDSKLYFNYGHFLSEPESSYRFRLQRESNGLVTYMGNPDLKMEKTIAYELGFEQNLLDMMSFNLAAYYKDVSDQIGWIYYQNINNSVQYRKASNNNYADIRGLEITITKRTGRWFAGFVNYTYDVRTSGYFGLVENYEDPNLQRDYLRLNPYQSKPEPQPYARAHLDLHTPENWGPIWLSWYPLASWYLNMIANWRAGSYYTYNPNKIPGVVNDTQWKDRYNLDLRLSKMVRLNRFQIQFYMDITNVLNIKRLNFSGFADNYDWLDYLNSLNFSWEEGDEKGSDRIGEYRPDDVTYDPLEPNPNNDPEIGARNKKRKDNKSYIDMPNIKSLTFLAPRDIIFGLKINF